LSHAHQPGRRLMTSDTFFVFLLLLTLSMLIIGFGFNGGL
jgi:hypothetical protein